MPIILWMLLTALPAGAAGGGAIVVSDHFQDPATLDPPRQFSEKNHTIVQQIYDGLLRFTPEGTLEPALAESWRWIDDRTLELRLRPGVVFHNGEPFDAESARASIARYLDPATEFPARPFIDTIESAQAVDPLTLRVRTRVPDGLLLNRLAAFVLITPPQFLRKEGARALEERPVGTGPFRFVRWDKGHSLELEANERYWAAGYPKARRLVFRFLPKEKQISALLSGEVDVVTDVPGTKTGEIARSGSARVIKKPTFYTVGTTLEIVTGPLKDVRVRRALNHAINQQDLIRYDQMGNAVPIASLSMPGQHGHADGLAPYPFDPEKARALLREAGYPDGLTLSALAQVENKRAIQILRSQWERIGVTLDISWTDDGKVMEDMRTKRVDIALGSCPDPMASSYFVLNLLLYSKSPYSLTRSDELDALLEKAVSSTDPLTSARALQDADRLINREALSFFTYQKTSVSAVRRGILFTPYVTGMPYFFSLSRSEP